VERNAKREGLVLVVQVEAEDLEIVIAALA
jgi:hypothetical protein